MKLTRLSAEPILLPVEEHEWERAAVFNAAAVYHNGLFHMVYRATDLGGDEKYGKYINSLGYASSTDLLTWHRCDKPILTNSVPGEERGPEDPRVVRIENLFYMTYVGYRGRVPDDYRICLATSKDLIHWNRKGILLDGPLKNASLFSERIEGKYCLLYRPHPDIWIGFSEDLRNWTGHKKIMSPLPNTWNQTRIGIAGPPVKIDDGWFLIFHGVDEYNRYSLGAALLDYKDPARVLARQTEPIIEPELDWEINGNVPDVIFSCATVLQGDRIYCLYGGADTVMGVAYIDVRDVVF
ncbi:MAG: glycosidase [Candidatus Neomarinimicrobiota bacterium]